MAINEKWYATRQGDRKRVRLSGVTADRSTLDALRKKARREGVSLGVLLERLVRPGLGLGPLEGKKKES